MTYRTRDTVGRTGILQSLWNLGIQASGDRVRRSSFHAAVLRSMNQEPRRWLKARAFQKESPGFSRGEDVKNENRHEENMTKIKEEARRMNMMKFILLHQFENGKQIAILASSIVGFGEQDNTHACVVYFNNTSVVV